MDIDDRITLAKKLIAQREEIDQKLAELFGVESKPRVCGKCNKPGHTARSCTEEPAAVS